MFLHITCTIHTCSVSEWSSEHDWAWSTKNYCRFHQPTPRHSNQQVSAPFHPPSSILSFCLPSIILSHSTVGLYHFLLGSWRATQTQWWWWMHAMPGSMRPLVPWQALLSSLWMGCMSLMLQTTALVTGQSSSTLSWPHLLDEALSTTSQASSPKTTALQNYNYMSWL